jgi:hypothetical protein
VYMLAGVQSFIRVPPTVLGPTAGRGWGEWGCLHVEGRTARCRQADAADVHSGAEGGRGW